MNYSLLLHRNTDFNAYKNFYYPAYPTELHRPLHLALIQMLWDRSDPNGYAHHMTTDPLPGTPQHQVLLHLAFGDHQVANVATEIEARTIGASIHVPAIAGGRHSDVNPYYGITRSGAIPGSALIVGTAAPHPPITTADGRHRPARPPARSAIARQQKSDSCRPEVQTDVCSACPSAPRGASLTRHSPLPPPAGEGRLVRTKTGGPERAPARSPDHPTDFRRTARPKRDVPVRPNQHGPRADAVESSEAAVRVHPPTDPDRVGIDRGRRCAPPSPSPPRSTPAAGARQEGEGGAEQVERRCGDPAFRSTRVRGVPGGARNGVDHGVDAGGCAVGITAES
jgi:hypothetical protein